MYTYNIYIGFTFNASVLQGRNQLSHTFLGWTLETKPSFIMSRSTKVIRTR